MSEERSRKKPLIVGGIVAAAGAGWLAIGLRRGQPLPKNLKEALANFRDPTDVLQATKLRVMTSLLGQMTVHSGDLLTQIAEPDELPELAQRKLLKTMSSLGRATLGEWALAQLANDVRIGRDPSSEYSYSATKVARQALDSGQLPEIILPPSDNS